MIIYIYTPWQTAFVPGRKIQENTFLAQEIIHEMKKKKGRTGWMGLKIDIETAYDKIEWSFLKMVMTNFGFPQIWIQWMMQCVTTTSFSVLINGSPFRHFKPQRGLRQGDPLSHFLFVLAYEVLSKLIEREAVSNKINGFKLARDLAHITHLQFADDLFIFVQANEENMNQIKVCLETFEKWSGQKVNFFKSVIIFSKNMSQAHKRRLANLIGINASSKKEKYLGLPMVSGREKKAAIDKIIEKVKQRLQGWKMKTLSQVGRTTLISSAAAAMPSYQALSLLLPKKVCEKLDSLNRNFWWGCSDEKKHGLYLKN